MSYEEKTIYKETKALQWCKEGLVCELTDVAAKLMIASTDEDILNLLDALALDIETVVEAMAALGNTKAYFAKKEANNE